MVVDCYFVAVAMCFPSAVKQALHNQQRTFFLRIQIKSCCNIVKALQNNVLTRVTSVSPAGNPFITLAYLRFRVVTQLRGVCLFTQSRTAFQASSVVICRRMVKTLRQETLRSETI